jgi:hypothetical protein
MEMDFKSILNKLDSMDAPVVTPAAPKLDKAVQLNEDAQLRVLSGRSTYVAEAKKKAEEDVKEATKTDKPWTDMKGNKHPGTAVKGEKYTGKEAEKEEKKAKKESVEPQFKSKFMKMVEAKKAEKDDKKKSKKEQMEEAAKPDFLDLDKDGDKKEPMKSAAKSKGGDKKDSGKKGMSAAQAKYFGKKESVKEATKTDKPWTDMSGKKHPGTAVKGDKYTGKEAEKETKEKSKKDESVSRRKAVVAESAMSFKEMLTLVQESGGQQQIDPVDQSLWSWAQRVAATKLGEGLKADVYAGMVYERMGGTFEMYDVLSEAQK